MVTLPPPPTNPCSCRTHASGSLLGPDMDQFQGPALLVYNDKPFSAEDIRRVQAIGSRGKEHVQDTIGAGCCAGWRIAGWRTPLLLSAIVNQREQSFCLTHISRFKEDNSFSCTRLPLEAILPEKLSSSFLTH